MHFFNHLRYGLIALMVLLGLLSTRLPQVVQSMDEALDKTTRHDIGWSGVNGRNEHNELTMRVLGYMLNHNNTDFEAAQVAYDVLVSRMVTWKTGSFGQFVQKSPERQRSYNIIAAKVRALDGMFSDLSVPVIASFISGTLAEIEPHIEKIAGDAFTSSNIELAKNNERMRDLQFMQQAILVGLIATGFILVVLLLLQNWLLAKSNRSEKASSEANAFLASHDGLTGLPNRSTFQSALADFNQGSKPRTHLMVATLDLDGFKPINDVLGHHTGDMLLQSVAKKLEAIALACPGSMASRLGGDEFTMFFPDIHSHKAAQAKAELILHTLRQPNDIEGHQISIDATIGVYVVEDDCLNPEDMINRSDIALNHAKANSKGTCALFEPKMLERIAARRTIAAELAEAPLWDQIEPYYQPIVDLISGEIVAVEALARWHHPLRGNISPIDFIPVAESSGRIVEIGNVMLEKACRDAMAFPHDISVSVNVSAAQLIRMDLPRLVDGVLQRSGLAPHRLKLELTESLLINDANGTHRHMRKLQDRGITISLDDFGTGYSSLSYLHGFGFDELKIDRSFVAAMAGDQQAIAIIQTIIALAQNLDMKLVAEGIETEKQVILLSAMGCRVGQGYFFGKPMTAASLKDLLHDRPGTTSMACVA